MTWARNLEERRERRAAEKERNLAILCRPLQGDGAEVQARARALHQGSYGRAELHADPKVLPVRSEAYRRAVASLCCIHCGRLPTQCAHANTGKGMGTKACDLNTFPLCPDCHRAFDQGALFTKEKRREIEPQWIAATRTSVLASGLWPKNLEVLT